jgi:hypothetical protein
MSFHVIAFRIALSFDEILELSRLFIVSVTLDLIHFVLIFSINQIRWRLGEVGPV